MMICRTPDINKLGFKFIMARPLFVLLYIFVTLILCTLCTIAIIISDNQEIMGWIFLVTVISDIIILCTHTIRSENYFNVFIENENKKIILINSGNIFTNNRLFGGKYHPEGKLEVFINWFKAAGRMKKFQTEEDFDNFIMNDYVLSSGHYIKNVFKIKSSKKYIIAKIRLRQCNAMQSNMLTEFNKTVRIPRNFINSEQLENLLMNMTNCQQ